MSPLSKTLLLASTLLPTAFSLPTVQSRQTPTTSANFTISGYSETNPAINSLTFGLSHFADGLLQATLYDHGSIPLNYGAAFNFVLPDGELEVAANTSVQAVLLANGVFNGGAVGTKGFYNTPETGYLAFDRDNGGLTQNLFEACPFPTTEGSEIRYTVGWLDVSNPQPAEGCEEIRLKPDIP